MAGLVLMVGVDLSSTGIECVNNVESGPKSMSRDCCS